MARTTLVTGALGQIGSELVPALRARYGVHAVVAADLRGPPQDAPGVAGPFEQLDCTAIDQVRAVVTRHDVGTIYHLVSLLSAASEHQPQAAWRLNLDSIFGVLEAAREHGSAVFFPSSIGAFGPSTPRDRAPQETIMRPTTMYGVTKVASELLCDYYAHHFGVDARGLRLPGLISHVAMPGGGTTDYAVEIFYQAVRHRHYLCPLAPDTRLEMMFMPDAVRAMIELMEADGTRLRHRNAYNITAINVSPEELAAAIRVHLPDFTVAYSIDPVRQAIAESWPRSIDDSAARQDWGWSPRYGLAALTADMLEKIREKLAPAQ